MAPGSAQKGSNPKSNPTLKMVHTNLYIFKCKGLISNGFCSFEISVLLGVYWALLLMTPCSLFVLSHFVFQEEGSWFYCSCYASFFTLYG